MPWLWFRIKLNWYSMRFFQGELLGFNNLWIYFSFREFNCVSMSKIPSPLVKMESWTRCLGGHISFSFQRKSCIFLGIFWNSTNLVYVQHFGWEGLVYDYPFLRQSHSVPDMDFFCYTTTYFVPFGVIENRVTKVNSKYFNGNFHYFICPGWSILFLYAPAHKASLFGKFIFELDASSYSFKITFCW